MNIIVSYDEHPASRGAFACGAALFGPFGAGLKGAGPADRHGEVARVLHPSRNLRSPQRGGPAEGQPVTALTLGTGPYRA